MLKLLHPSILPLALATWCVADGPQGLSSVLQSLLWPVWMDPGRQRYTPGLIKYLWKRTIKAPQIALSLRGDSFAGRCKVAICAGSPPGHTAEDAALHVL